MKILVLGSIEQARALLRRAPRQVHPVDHCARAVRVTRSFSPVDPPDWILIEGTAISTEGIALIQSLRTMDFSTGPVSMEGSGRDLASHCGHTGCSVEQDDNGVLRLRCSRHQALCRQLSGNGTNTEPASAEAEVRFEYQAPPRRRSN